MTTLSRVGGLAFDFNVTLTGAGLLSTKLGMRHPRAPDRFRYGRTVLSRLAPASGAFSQKYLILHIYQGLGHDGDTPE